MKVLLLIQKFLASLFNSIASFGKILLLSKFGVHFPEGETKELVILGNGPSLNNSLETQMDFLEGKTLLCVNFFPTTAYYEKLKPSIFVSIAPDLWLPDVDQKFIDQRIRLFDALVEKTNWDLDFYFPWSARSVSTWRDKLAENKNIKVHYLNTTPVTGLRSVSEFFFRKSLGMPRPHNVMIPSLFTGIQMRFKTIYLLGADHSWLREISVNDDNVALINQKHFYDETSSKPDTLDKSGKGARKLHEILFKLMNAFASYFVIKDYAESQGCRILNATPNSFIDAFDRIKLNGSETV